jgi:acetolactate synthase-1/2/3 large subunit
MKLSDYVAQFLAREGIHHVFGLTGGAVVHLFDSLARTDGITPIFTHHEQAAALAASFYARASNNLGAAVVTTGPGGTNTITGLLGAWLDSIPCIFISGQTRIKHTSRGKPIRQVGSQEFDIVSLVTPITKYAVMVDEAPKIKYYLQKAVYIARSGRPGPVWIDIPLDFQWATIEPEQLENYRPPPVKVDKTAQKILDAQLQTCAKLLSAAHAPLILAGRGIKVAGAETAFTELIETYDLPFVSAWGAVDLLPSAHPLNAGLVGLQGQRGGNQIVKKCDFLLAIGSHLCLTITGIDPEKFAPEATKVIVDIDPVELKYRAVKTELAIEADAGVFLQKLLRVLKKKKISGADGKKRCLDSKAANAIPIALKAQQKYVNPYVFVDAVGDALNAQDTVVVDGGGTVVYISYQAFKVKTGQRLLLSTGMCAMGTGLAESIGACFARGRKRTICFIGDGAMQFNIQELQTIVHHKLPIKIFVFNNDGYLAIRHTQDGFLDHRYIGANKSGGVSLPDFCKVAKAYGIPAFRINSHKQLTQKIKRALQGNHPVLCEIMISPEQQLLPVL